MHTGQEGGSVQTQTQENFGEINYLSEIALSPDGRYVLFVGRWIDKKAQDQELSALFLLALDEQGRALGAPKVLTSQIAHFSSPVWSSDSHWILFLSNYNELYAQLWLTNREGITPQKLTNMEYGVHEVATSPDGRWVALTALATPTSALTTEYGSQSDEQPFAQYTQLFLMAALGSTLEAENPVLRRLTDGSVDYMQPSWTPDSQEIGVLCNQEEGLERSFITDLWAVEPVTGAMRCLTNRQLEIECYAWSPDGRSAILVAGLDGLASEGSTQLYLVTRHGNVGDNVLLLAPELTSVTLSQTFANPGTPGPYRPVWSKDGQKVYFLLTEQQDVNVYSLEIVWRTLNRLTEQSLSYFLALLPSALLVAQQYPGQGWELYRVSLDPTQAGESEQLTDFHTQPGTFF
jgi:Tol biopolymer transport system component